jgi:membrane protein implicated in regulation of membrane protease activity
MNRFLSRLAINSAAILIASAGGCVAMVFLFIAAYIGLSTVMAPWLAALVIAGAALVFVLLVLLIARAITRKVVPSAAKARHRSTAELGELLGRQAHDFVAGNSPMMLGGLLVVGFAMGFSPRLRKLLMKLL